MPQKRKPVTKKRPGKIKPPSRWSDKESIIVGNVTGNTGIAIGHGARASVLTNSETGSDEIARIFRLLKQRVNQSPQGTDRDIAKNALQALEVEARKGSKANETSVRKWLNFLAETLPDVWEVAIDTFLNPVKGAGTAFRKIAERAKAERDAGKT